jgi:hypothetical protein
VLLVGLLALVAGSGCCDCCKRLRDTPLRDGGGDNTVAGYLTKNRAAQRVGDVKDDAAGAPQQTFERVRGGTAP